MYIFFFQFTITAFQVHNCPALKLPENPDSTPFFSFFSPVKTPDQPDSCARAPEETEVSVQRGVIVATKSDNVERVIVDDSEGGDAKDEKEKKKKKGCCVVM